MRFNYRLVFLMNASTDSLECTINFSCRSRSLNLIRYDLYKLIAGLLSSVLLPVLVGIRLTFSLGTFLGCRFSKHYSAICFVYCSSVADETLS